MARRAGGPWAGAAWGRGRPGARGQTGWGRRVAWSYLFAARASLGPRVCVPAARRGERGPRTRRAGVGLRSSVTPAGLRGARGPSSGPGSLRPLSSCQTAGASRPLPTHPPPLQLPPPFSSREVNLTTTKKYVQNPDVPCPEPQREKKITPSWRNLFFLCFASDDRSGPGPRERVCGTRPRAQGPVGP